MRGKMVEIGAPEGTYRVPLREIHLRVPGRDREIKVPDSNQRMQIQLD